MYRLCCMSFVSQPAPSSRIVSMYRASAVNTSRLSWNATHLRIGAVNVSTLLGYGKYVGSLTSETNSIDSSSGTPQATMRCCQKHKPVAFDTLYTLLSIFAVLPYAFLSKLKCTASVLSTNVSGVSEDIRYALMRIIASSVVGVKEKLICSS